MEKITLLAAALSYMQAKAVLFNEPEKLVLESDAATLVLQSKKIPLKNTLKKVMRYRKRYLIDSEAIVQAMLAQLLQ